MLRTLFLLEDCRELNYLEKLSEKIKTPYRLKTGFLFMAVWFLMVSKID